MTAFHASVSLRAAFGHDQLRELAMEVSLLALTSEIAQELEGLRFPVRKPGASPGSSWRAMPHMP